MHKKELAVLGGIDCVILAIVRFAYFNGSFAGSSPMWTVAITLPIVLSLAYLSERSVIKLNGQQEPLSLMPSEEQGFMQRHLVRASEESSIQSAAHVQSTPATTWALISFAILLILIATVLEIELGNVPFASFWPVPALAISLVMTGFQFALSCWKISWAEADPGVNLLRSLALGMLCLVAFGVVYMAIELNLGTLDWSEMNSEFLQQLLALSFIRSYSYKMGHTVEV